MLYRDELVVIPQAYSGRRFGWLGPWFYPDLEVFHIKSGVLLLLRVWLQLVTTAVGSVLLQLVVTIVGGVTIGCNKLYVRLM